MRCAIRSAHLLLLVTTLLLSSCGVLTEADFPGCEPTGSVKTYRTIGCGRVCKAQYANCSNGKTADPDSGCACTKDPINLGSGMTEPPSTVSSSCACYFPGTPAYVSLHLAGACPAWLPNVGTSEIRTGIGRPIGSGADPSCTAVCTPNGGSELRGVFTFRSSKPGSCTDGATMFPGTLLGDFEGGGQLALDSEAPARHSSAFVLQAEAKLQRLDYQLAESQKFIRLPVQAPAAQSASGGSRFAIRDLKISCTAECAKGGEHCTQFQVSSSNVNGLNAILSRISDRAQVHTIKDWRAMYDDVQTSCAHETLEVNAQGLLSSKGSACSQRLYLTFPTVQEFSSTLSIPAVVEAHFVTIAGVRQVTFSKEESMPVLNLTPLPIHRLYGGKIRFASVDAQRLVLETQNHCLAVKLQ